MALRGQTTATKGTSMTLLCGICGRELESEDELGTHTHESGDREAIREALTCPACGEQMETEERLLRHRAEDHVGLETTDEEHGLP